MSDLWMPGAVRRPGPPWKSGYSFVGESGPKRGEVDHSAEGFWSGLHNALDGPAPKSWHFTIGYNWIEQHYPLRVHCWHAGDVDDDGAVAANLDLVGKEHLGVAGQPLTPFQVEASMRVTRWCAEQEGKISFSRYPNQDGWTLAEHNQVSDTPTACPSNRIPWGIFMPALEEDADMAAIDEVRRDVARLTLENRLQQGAIELQSRINQLQQGWLNQHAEGHGAAPSAELAELAGRLVELEAKVAEAGAALTG